MARSARSGVTMPSSAILRSTWLRRPFAASGARVGEYCDGACGRPASSAASRSVRSLTRLEK